MSVTDILLQLNSNDNAVRSQAEQIVASEQQNNFANFCISLLNELRDDSKSDASRQTAGVLLKNTVALDVKNQAQKDILDERWKQLGPEIRKQVKDTVLDTLGSNAPLVRGVAALIIANLARIELPYNEWPDLIQTLVKGCNTGLPVYMEAALQTLGYICEEAMNHDDVADVLEKESRDIIHAIGAGMSRTEDTVKLSAVRALANSLEFVGEHLKDPNIQNFIISSTCDMTKLNNASIREIAMRCLVKIADLYYDLLATYIERLFEVTSTTINNPQEEERVVLQALLFWIALGENERERLENGDQCFNFSASGCEVLVAMCLSCLVKQDPNQTEEDWNISTAGSKLLQTLAETVGNPVCSPVMKFVYVNHNNADWRFREAAMMAFGCVMAGPDADEFANTVAQGVSVYLDGLSDPHPLVADTAGWVTAVVCENFPKIFTMQPAQCDILIQQKVGPLIAGNNTGMAIRACSIIHNLGLAFEDEDEEGGMATNCFSPYYKNLVQALLARVDRDPDPEFFGRDRKLAIESLNVLIDAAANDVSSVIAELVPMLITRLEFFNTQYKQYGGDDILTVESLLCGSLSAVCKKMGSHVAPYVDSIMGLLSKLFAQQADTSLEEAVMLLGTLANAMGGDFARYAEMVIDLVLRCAVNFEEEDLCDAAVGVIGDFAASLGPTGFAPFMEKVVNAIFGALVNPDVDREQKLTYFGCAGDICLHCGSAFTPYVQTLMGIAQTAFNESCGINFKNDDDEEYYVMSLWESLCQLCGLILQGQRDVDGAITTFAPNMLNLADYVCRNSHSCSEETFAAALGLIGDVANCCIDRPTDAQVVGPLLVQQNISQCISKGSESKSEAAKQAKWAHKQIVTLMGAQR